MISDLCIAAMLDWDVKVVDANRLEAIISLARAQLENLQVTGKKSSLTTQQRVKVHRRIHDGDLRYGPRKTQSKLPRLRSVPLNLADNVVPLAKERIPVVQRLLRSLVEILPLWNAVLGFQR